MKEVQVHCYSGHTYAERPASFTWQDITHNVEAVEKEWRDPGSRCFRVCTEDKRIFELCYNERQDEWSLRESGGKELGQ